MAKIIFRKIAGKIIPMAVKSEKTNLTHMLPRRITQGIKDVRLRKANFRVLKDQIKNRKGAKEFLKARKAIHKEIGREVDREFKGFIKKIKK